MEHAKITDPCMPAGTVMSFLREDAPEGWEKIGTRPPAIVPPAAHGAVVIVCRKL